VIINISEYEAPLNTLDASSSCLVTHIGIEQSASGLFSSQETRCLDDVAYEHTDWLFGTLKSRSRWASLDDVDDDHGKGSWEYDNTGHDFITTRAESVRYGWVACQLWGFQKVGGERRYCCHVIVSKGNRSVATRLVYDYVE
jgi:hypothetical protein